MENRPSHEAGERKYDNIDLYLEKTCRLPTNLYTIG